MSDASDFIHNFCESRLTNNQPPEMYNSYTSLIITFFPLVMGFPKNNIFYNVACMLAFNGIASFYYHYTLSWIGKQADEISMILATYYGMWGLLKMYYINSDRKMLNWYNGWNTIAMISFLIFNTISYYDYLFPYLFSVYILISILMIRKVALKYNLVYKPYLLTSGVGAEAWILSEIYCTEMTKYGHVVWHLLFPLGFYSLVLAYDNHLKNMRITKNAIPSRPSISNL
ncbi:MAG: hypothetical protein CMI56_00220 [Parcubacteria group bacterium]|nr:hypothetical protein [Parcubacteria group bacterium]|tara:strand:- start:411 stop:1097 length:687 start_codon:yes stop_codon:yes gene_type:complete